ncbi:NAD(P)/FAD-dependent oxidoreductase [Leekyejoonella antrihumi]|uniref:FAD-dependent oxidoreductase n=1 Tax=Leekyejoonella antrihumi TaxID=1660198 RepID=A0A563E262_9MICO|nr:FAD-binding oxidoreductase [Leekyejoonella antrihumi]TWP36627.1 FAD-dependent oxidoreductase [Leekyejoonella antrihumi]
MSATRNAHPNHPYVSLWLDEAFSTEQRLPVDLNPLPRTADVVIVGGGYTGLWTAIRLLEHDPSLVVCIVEAQYCGYGASGRNGGIADTSWAKFPTMVKLFGLDDAVRLARAIEAGLDELCGFCTQHGIDAQIRRRGSLWTATNAAQVDSWHNAVDACTEAHAHPFRPVDTSESRILTESQLALGGVFEHSAASIQPARLVRALRRTAIKFGAQIHESTTMTSFNGAGPVRVHTTRGTITAQKVVLATNAWLARTSTFKPYLFVTSSDIIATAPIPQLLDPDGLGSGIALSDSRRLILYWRSTPDGRVVFGKGGGHMSRYNHVDRRFTGRSTFTGQVTERLHRLYPQLAQVPIEHTWTGPIDYSVTGLPYFGPVDDSNHAVLAGVGYSGMGVLQTILGGRILASLVTERDDEWAAMPLTRRWPNRLPPDPWRSAGAPLVKAATMRKERLMDEGRQPWPLTCLVAGLDPTTAPSQS